MRARICGPHREAGMVTAETAVVLPVLLLVLAGAVAAVTVIGAELRCVDAAREGARAAARGEDPAAGAAAAAVSAGSGAERAACTVAAGAVVDVAGRIRVRLGRLGIHAATARARAGPAVPRGQASAGGGPPSGRASGASAGSSS